MTNEVLNGHDALRDYWYVVGEGTDVTPGPRSVRLLGRDLVVWRSPDGTVVAAPDRCPHREAPLSLGRVEDGCLVCAYHGWTFGDGGRCVEVPSSAPGVPVPPKGHLPVVCAAERYGLVWVCLGTPRAPIPVIAEEDDAAYRRINSGVAEWSDLGHPDDGQLPRHRPLPVRAHRHAGAGGQSAGAEVRDHRRSMATSSATSTRSRSATNWVVWHPGSTRRSSGAA